MHSYSDNFHAGDEQSRRYQENQLIHRQGFETLDVPGLTDHDVQFAYAERSAAFEHLRELRAAMFTLGDVTLDFT